MRELGTLRQSGRIKTQGVGLVAATAFLRGEALACQRLEPAKDFFLFCGRKAVNQIESPHLGLSLGWPRVNLDIANAA